MIIDLFDVKQCKSARAPVVWHTKQLPANDRHSLLNSSEGAFSVVMSSLMTPGYVYIERKPTTDIYGLPLSYWTQTKCSRRESKVFPHKNASSSPSHSSWLPHQLCYLAKNPTVSSMLFKDFYCSTSIYTEAQNVNIWCTTTLFVYLDRKHFLILPPQFHFIMK